MNSNWKQRMEEEEDRTKEKKEEWGLNLALLNKLPDKFLGLLVLFSPPA